VWEFLIEYGRTAWEKCRKLIKQFPCAKKKAFKRFDDNWEKNQVLCVRVGNFVKLIYDGLLG